MSATKTLLEFAAKAAGIPTDNWNDGTEPYSSGEGFILASGRIWNPLLSNDNAFTLMIALGISLPTRLGDQCYAYVNGVTYKEVGPDPADATRRVIVKAAAYIGKGML